jgi:hypothetical protein
MKDSVEEFELELSRHRPAAPPSDFLARLREAAPVSERVVSEPALARAGSGFWIPGPGWLVLRRMWRSLRWGLAPAALLVTAGVIILNQLRGTAPDHSEMKSAPARVLATESVRADHVNIEQELVNSFDAVALLPTGEPVRYRCREWVDQVTLRDRSRGVIVEQRAPRVEVVPVRFETY